MKLHQKIVDLTCNQRKCLSAFHLTSTFFPFLEMMDPACSAAIQEMYSNYPEMELEVYNKNYHVYNVSLDRVMNVMEVVTGKKPEPDLTKAQFEAALKAERDALIAKVKARRAVLNAEAKGMKKKSFNC
jgi:hypothetical protein